MLGYSPLYDVGQHARGDRPQLSDDLSRVLKSSRMGVAGCEIPVDSGMAWEFAQSCEECRDRLVEAAFEKAGHADAEELGRISIKRTEADGDLQMLDRDILLTGPQPQPPAYPPTAVAARIEVEGAVNQRDCRLDVLSKISEQSSDIGDRARIAGRGLQCAVGVAERRTAMRPGSSTPPTVWKW